MLITYQTRVDVTNPSTWEAPINEIGEYVESLYLSDGAKPVVQNDPVYKNIHEEEIRESWRLCLAERARNKACRQVVINLVDKWDIYSPGEARSCVVSVVFFAAHRDGVPLIEEEPVILISEISSPAEEASKARVKEI